MYTQCVYLYVFTGTIAINSAANSVTLIQALRIFMKITNGLFTCITVIVKYKLNCIYIYMLYVNKYYRNRWEYVWNERECTLTV